MSEWELNVTNKIFFLIRDVLKKKKRSVLAEVQQNAQSERLVLGGYNFLGKQFSNMCRGPLKDTVVPI